METNTTANGSAGHNPSQGIFLPIAIAMLSLLIFFGWQLSLVRKQNVLWKKQIEQREPLVGQCRNIQAELQKIVSELMTMSITDADAKAIIDRYQIRQGGPQQPQLR